MTENRYLQNLKVQLGKLRYTLGYRLTLWYGLAFVLGVAILFFFSYLLLSSSIRQSDQEKILLQLDVYRAEYEKSHSVTDLVRLLNREQEERQNLFLIRFADPVNRTIFARVPPQWRRIPVTLLENYPPRTEPEWLTVSAGDDQLEIASVRLSDFCVLQVGAGTAGRLNTLATFRRVFWLTTIPMFAFAMLGGFFVASRALRPLRELVEAVRAIITTGKTDKRVPELPVKDEVGELVLDFNQMLDRIDGLLKGMRDSLDNVAHDLRTPMTRLRGMAEMALQSDNPTDHREALADALEESEHMLSMLRTLMDISEAETGTMKLSVQPLNLAELVAEIAELYQFVAEEKSITITTEIPEGLMAAADRNRLRQVLANLLDNAVKYTPEGGKVTLSAHNQTDSTIITLQDSGIGIAPEEIPRIWERLYRADASRSERGLGLGLSLVKAVVKAHDGDISVTSEPGKGSTFVVSLPLK